MRSLNCVARAWVQRFVAAYVTAGQCANEQAYRRGSMIKLTAIALLVLLCLACPAPVPLPARPQVQSVTRAPQGIKVTVAPFGAVAWMITAHNDRDQPIELGNVLLHQRPGDALDPTHHRWLRCKLIRARLGNHHVISVGRTTKGRAALGGPSADTSCSGGPASYSRTVQQSCSVDREVLPR